MSEVNEQLKRRYSDKHVIENIVTAIVVGFFSAVFGGYIAQAKQEVEMEHVVKGLNEIKNELSEVRKLETRVAILEYELGKK